MRPLLLFTFVFVFLRPLWSQSIAATNFNYWYNPQNDVQLQLRPVRVNNKIMVLYTLMVRLGSPEKYTIAWERRNAYDETNGVPVGEKDSVLSVTAYNKRGILTFNLPDKPWLLVAQVSNSSKSWMYYKQIESIYPIDGWIESSEGVITQNHLNRNAEYTVRSGDGNPLIVSYYHTTFPAALPPFAVQEARAERFIFHDSIFTIRSGNKFLPKQEGLYLFQGDTTAARGFSYRVVRENFPKFTKIDELVPPLIFVTTSGEFANLSAAKNDKATFDRIILGITEDKERARIFMRNYFRNVELANIFFSSYKEGWKTDRGMMFLIFGLPDEVRRNGGNEICTYKMVNKKFTFVKNGSVYDPENYVLIRDKQFSSIWFETADLWRKGRFKQ